MKQKRFIAILAVILIIWVSIPRQKTNPYYVESVIDYEAGVSAHYPVTGNEKLDSKMQNFVNQTVEEYKASGQKNTILNISFKCYSSLFTIIRFRVSTDKEQNARGEFTSTHWHKNFFTFSSKPYIPTVSTMSTVDNGTHTEIKKDKKLVALTFDDGPSQHTMSILNTLNEHESHATFCVLGNKVDSYKEAIEIMHASGHEIANHTFDHKKLTALSESAMLEEIAGTQEAVKSITGEYPTFLRPTYGSFNSKVREGASMPLLMWNKDTLDWKSKNVDYIFTQATSNLKDGDIILFHDIYPTTAQAIEKIVPYLVENGYQLVTVSELLEAKGIVPENGKAYFSSRSST